MDNKFNIGDLVFWYGGDQVAGFGVIDEINLDKKGYSYHIYDETDYSDYATKWLAEEQLYSDIKDFDIIANRLRIDTEKWISECRDRLEKRLKKEE